MKLPLREYSFYAGIDPGFEGGFALINAAGSTVKAWAMPVKKLDKGHDIDLDGLRDSFRYLKRFPDVAVAIEWPSTRPGEGAERSEKFGRGKGYLEAFAFLHGFEHFRIAPNLWTGRMALPGKEREGWLPARIAALAAFYPGREGLVRGPKGGVRDGLLDAILIAHFLRVQGVGISGCAAVHGRGSIEVQARALVTNGRHRRGMLPSI